MTETVNDATPQAFNAEFEREFAERSAQAEAWAQVGAEWSRDYPTLREGYDAIAQEIKDQYLDPNPAALLDPGIDYVRWRLFAQPGDPLPDTLRLAREDVRVVSSMDVTIPHLSIQVNPSHPAYKYGRYASIEQFIDIAIAMDEGIAPLMEMATSYHRQERLADAASYMYRIENAVKASKAYEFLQTFLEDVPHQDERPLTQFEKQARAAQAEHEVRHRFSIPTTDQLDRTTEHGHHASKELAKKIFQLDDETLTTLKPKREDEGLMRFKRHVTDIGLAHMNEIDPDGQWQQAAAGTIVRNKQIDDSGASEERSPRGTLTPIELFEGRGKSMVADQMLRECGITFAGNDDVDRDLMDMAVYFARHHPTMKGVLDAAVQKLSSNTLYWLTKSVEPTEHNKLVGSLAPKMNVGLMLSTLQPEAKVIINNSKDFEWYIPRPEGSYWGNIYPQIHSSESEELAKPLATVKRYGAALDDPHGRLLISASIPVGLPPFDSKADLIISSNPISERTDIDVPGVWSSFIVPGYHASAVVVDEARVVHTQYRRSVGEHDPYSESAVPLGESWVGSLADWYQQQGLSQLAEALRRYPQATTADLARIISETSDYTYDTSLLPANGIEIPVIDGRAQIQCTGAAALLAKSLNRVFHERNAVILSGHMLDAGDGNLGGIGHAQVMFTYGGKKYIHDATPASRDGQARGRARGERAGGRAGLMQAMAGLMIAPFAGFKRTDVVDEDKPADVEVVPTTTEELAVLAAAAESAPKPPEVADETPPVPYFELREEKPDFEAMRERLETKLRIIFDLPNRDMLLKKIVSLPDADPVRRTLSLAAQSTSEHGIETDTVKLREYLESYAASSPQLRQQLKLQTYSPELVTALGHYVADLEKAL